MAIAGLFLGTVSCRESTGEKAEETIESAAQDTEDNLEKAGEEIIKNIPNVKKIKYIYLFLKPLSMILVINFIQEKI